jgi:hypothetical protein
MHVKEAFGAISILTAILVGMNVRTAIATFVQNQYIVYLGALMLLASLVINVAYRVIDKSLDVSTMDANAVEMRKAIQE